MSAKNTAAARYDSRNNIYFFASSYALAVQALQHSSTVSVSLPSYSLSRPAIVVPPGEETCFISSSTVIPESVSIFAEPTSDCANSLSAASGSMSTLFA